MEYGIRRLSLESDRNISQVFADHVRPKKREDADHDYSRRGRGPPASPIQQAEEYYRGLKGNGDDVIFIRYPPRGTRHFRNRITRST